MNRSFHNIEYTAHDFGSKKSAYRVAYGAGHRWHVHPTTVVYNRDGKVAYAKGWNAREQVSPYRSFEGETCKSFPSGWKTFRFPSSDRGKGVTCYREHLSRQGAINLHAGYDG